MNCQSHEEIKLTNIRIIDGDSHFERRSNLMTIDFSSLSNVDINSSRFFMNYNKLNEIKFGMEPPNQFHEDVFSNASIKLNFFIPSENRWKNYVPQCTINQDNDHYLRYGFDIGLIKEEEEIKPCNFPSQIILLPINEATVFNSNSITFALNSTSTYFLRKSLSYSLDPSPLMVNYLSINLIFSYLPYIIKFYSLTNSAAYQIIEIFPQKK